MSDSINRTLRFQAISFGVYRDTDAVTVGFEMDRREGHDSRGLLVSRATPEHNDRQVYIEFGEAQQHCMRGGIKSAQFTPGYLGIRFTEAASAQMSGLRIIEVLYDERDEEVPDLLDPLNYILEGS